MAKDQFIGAWDLVSFEMRHSDGTMSFPYGDNAIGTLIYHASGRMAVQVVRRDRPVFKSGDQLNGTSEEIKSAFEGCVAYFGTFEVDRTAGTVVHRVEASMFPNWVGTEQKRFYRLESDRLTLETVPIQWGGGEVVGALVWERAEGQAS